MTSLHNPIQLNFNDHTIIIQRRNNFHSKKKHHFRKLELHRNLNIESENNRVFYNRIICIKRTYVLHKFIMITNFNITCLCTNKRAGLSQLTLGHLFLMRKRERVTIIPFIHII